MLEIVRTWVGEAAPMRTLPRLTGLGVAWLAAARLPTLAMTPSTDALWFPREVTPRLLVVNPSDARWTDTFPPIVPATDVLSENCRFCEAPAAILVRLFVLVSRNSLTNIA